MEHRKAGAPLLPRLLDIEWEEGGRGLLVLFEDRLAAVTVDGEDLRGDRHLGRTLALPDRHGLRLIWTSDVFPADLRQSVSQFLAREGEDVRPAMFYMGMGNWAFDLGHYRGSAALP